MTDALPLITVSGSHHEIGQQIGEGMRHAIQGMLATYRENFIHAYDEVKFTWEQAILQAHKYGAFAEEYLPQYVDELRGMAEGANVTYDDLMVLNCTEAILSDALHLGCTSFAVNSSRSANGHVLVAHNEDWLPDDEPHTYLIHATPDDAPAFLAMTYGGLLPNIGFNQHGIAQCCDTVYPTDVRYGISRIFVSRHTLATTTIRRAVEATLHRQRAAGYNHLIADVNGELYNVEVSAMQFSLLYGGTEGVIAHTNNYQSPTMKAIEAEPDTLIGAHMRFNRAMRLLSAKEKHTVESLAKIQGDHLNYPGGICSHPCTEIAPHDRSKTICSLIMDLTALELHACWGNPCEATYHTYKLEI